MDEIAGDLPAPRDDEPASLRQNIVDELSDHLQCALGRERHRTGDEETAKQNVLERFGNPARVACRLWFDAMKEKIVIQRITLAAVLVLVAVCVCMGGMVWQVARENRATNLLLLEQNRKMNEALLEKLASPEMNGAGTNAGTSSEWAGVDVRLVTATEDGPPARGFRAKLWNHKSGADYFCLDALSDAEGKLDFGPVPAGANLGLAVESPWDAKLMNELRIFAQPGRDNTVSIVCPETPEPVDTALEIDWPDDFRAARLWAYCDICCETSLVEGAAWKEDWGAPRYTFVTDRGRLIHTGAWNAYIQDHAEYPPSGLDLTPSPQLRIDTRKRQLVCIRILLPPEAETAATHPPARTLAAYNFRHSVLIESPVLVETGAYLYASHDRTQSLGLIDFEQAESETARHGLTVVDARELEDSIQPAPRFAGEPGRVNRWKITLPDALVARVRERLESIEESQGRRPVREGGADAEPEVAPSA